MRCLADPRKQFLLLYRSRWQFQQPPFPRYFNHGVTSWSVITFSLRSQSLLNALWPKQDYAHLTPRTEANLDQGSYKGKRPLLSGK